MIRNTFPWADQPMVIRPFQGWFFFFEFSTGGFRASAPYGSGIEAPIAAPTSDDLPSGKLLGSFDRLTFTSSSIANTAPPPSH